MTTRYYEYEFWDTTNDCSILDFGFTSAHIIDWEKVSFTGFEFVDVSTPTIVCWPDGISLSGTSQKSK